ncbi:MAG TPA: hypothetical protein VHC22_20440 [Pirellulales bacterium]|nr:hypothetical protein [Pirellulales bacterium]
MRWWLCVGLLGFAVVLGPADVVSAGMGAPTLEDVPRIIPLMRTTPAKTTPTNTVRLRPDIISFFVVSLLLIAWAIQRVWNSLAKDFPRLPRISYLRSLGLLGLWGLLFLLVLTMISGAREWMTPGSWKKNGFTYQLVAPPAEVAPQSVATDGDKQVSTEPANDSGVR